MIKLSLILLASLVGFLVLPELLAGIAGIVFVTTFAVLFFWALGSMLSVMGSALSTLLGILFSVVAAVVIMVVLGVSIPLLLLVAIPVGLLFMIGCFFCTLLCAVV